MDEKRFRFDLLVALGALLISGVAAASSAYQTYVIRKQFSATVWPYLTFNTSSSSNKFFELDINNPGIGPALILASVVTRDGKAISRPVGPTIEPALGVAIDPERAAATADAAKSGTHGTMNVTITTIVAGDVVPAGSKLQLVRVEGKYIARRVIADVRRIDVTLCYCSLLGDCWTKRLWDSAVKPRPVAGCPHA
ncbi:MAG: hypothetical protein WB810_06780 [Candidatus Cybelea sp.]